MKEREEKLCHYSYCNSLEIDFIIHAHWAILVRLRRTRMPDKNLVNIEMFDLYDSSHNNYMIFKLNHVSQPSRLQSFLVSFHIIFL